MSGPGAFSVVPADLSAHAASLDSVAGRVTTAAQAASGIVTDTSAYGILCQFMPPILNIWGAGVAQGIADASTSLTNSASAVRASAESYRAADSTGAKRLAGAAGAGGPGAPSGPGGPQ